MSIFITKIVVVCLILTKLLFNYLIIDQSYPVVKKENRAKLQFKFDQIPEDHIVEEIEKQLAEALIEEDISNLSRSGKTITIEGDELPRRFVKFLVRKFLGQLNYGRKTRVISTSPGIFEIFYYQELE